MTEYQRINSYSHNLEGKPVVSIQVVLIKTQEVNLHKSFDHFKYSLRVNKENIWGK